VKLGCSTLASGLQKHGTSTCMLRNSSRAASSGLCLVRAYSLTCRVVRPSGVVNWKTLPDELVARMVLSEKVALARASLRMQMRHSSGSCELCGSPRLGAWAVRGCGGAGELGIPPWAAPSPLAL
jgi:hypothetical protein